MQKNINKRTIEEKVDEVFEEKDYNLYVKGFEDGYATAKRIL